MGLVKQTPPVEVWGHSPQKTSENIYVKWCILKHIMVNMRAKTYMNSPLFYQKDMRSATLQGLVVYTETVPHFDYYKSHSHMFNQDRLLTDQVSMDI